MTSLNMAPYVCLTGMIKTKKSDCQDMRKHYLRVEPNSVSEQVHFGLGSQDIYMKLVSTYLKQFTRRHGDLDF